MGTGYPRIVDSKTGFLLCYKCKEMKTPDDFYRAKDKKSGYFSHCKKCLYARHCHRLLTDPIYLAKHQARTKTHNTKMGRAKSHLKRRYGISRDDYDLLLSKQGGVCALCGDGLKENWRFKRFAIDHDHSHHPNNNRYGCKECIRGLLCLYCNTGYLPWVEKHPPLMTERIKNYLNGRPLSSPQSGQQEVTNSNVEKAT